MHRFTRLLRHLRHTRATARRMFPPATLQAIRSCIDDGEIRHRAEVRVVIEAALPMDMVVRAEHARARAHALFSLYRLWDTEENSGVLVYINLADRRVEIVPDRAVGRALKKADWEAICQAMTLSFAEGNFHDGVLQALSQMNQLLSLHFPAQERRKNEISNRPLLL